MLEKVNGNILKVVLWLYLYLNLHILEVIYYAANSNTIYRHYQGPFSHHFIILRNIITGPIRMSVTLHKAGKACQGQTLLLIGPI
jgi:hypothetical protein